MERPCFCGDLRGEGEMETDDLSPAFGDLLRVCGSLSLKRNRLLRESGGRGARRALEKGWILVFIFYCFFNDLVLGP